MPEHMGPSKTAKPADYYPGETKHGAAGGSSDTAMPGSGTQNLSPPNARGMGAAMTGAGLPPANGIPIAIAQPRGNPMPPGPVDVDGACPMPAMGEAALPPGPSCGTHDYSTGKGLPPGPDMGSTPRKGPRGPRGAQGGGGQLPPGPGV